MLGPDSGFVFLGCAMVVLGFNILGNLNKDATSVSNLGLPLWRIVIASGILSSLLGLLNIFATYVFCDSKQGINARQVRSHGAAIPQDNVGKSSLSVSSCSTRSPATRLPSYNINVDDRRKSRFGIRLPIRISGISRPVANDPEQFAKWDSRDSPVVPEVQRPPTALHPIYQKPTSPQAPRPPSSRYSVVSHLNRF